MDPARPGNPKNLLTLQEAAHRLAVSVDVLLEWNEHHILKPTITPTGEIGYTEEQLKQFLQIRESLQANQAIQKTSQSSSEKQPGRADFQYGEKSSHERKSSKPNLYQRFVRWVGEGFYTDDF